MADPNVGESTANKRAEIQGNLFCLLGGGLASALVTLIGSFVEANPTVIGQLAPVVGLLPESTYLALQLRRRAARRSTPALSRGDTFHPPIQVAILFGLLVFLSESLIGGIVGFSVGSAVDISGGDPSMVNQAMVPAARLLTTPLMLLAALLLARRLGHLIHKSAIGWLSLGVALWFVIRLVVILLVAQRIGLGQVVPNLIVAEVGLAVLLIGVTALGCLWAKRTQTAYAAAALLRRLTPDQQSAALMRLGEGSAQLTWPPPADPRYFGPEAGWGPPGQPPAH